MLRVIFGEGKHWEKFISENIDKSKYRYIFASLRTSHLDMADCVVPTSPDHYKELRKRQDKCRQNYIIPSENVADACHDKLRLNEILLASRFARLIPPLRGFGEAMFPYVLKRRKSAGGDGVFIVRDRDDEAEHLERIQSAEFFCQAYVAGEAEYATHLLMADGQLLYHATNIYHMGGEFTIKGRRNPETEETSIGQDTEIILMFSEMLKEIGYEGTCSIDYKVSDDGAQILEINPRCGFSLFRDINRYLDAYIETLRDGRRTGETITGSPSSRGA